MNKLREVDLPVCPVCGTIGKIPGRTLAGHKLSTKCIGPEGSGHRPTHMELVHFREVPNDDAS